MSSKPALGLKGARKLQTVESKKQSEENGSIKNEEVSHKEKNEKKANKYDKYDELIKNPVEKNKQNEKQNQFPQAIKSKDILQKPPLNLMQNRSAPYTASNLPKVGQKLINDMNFHTQDRFDSMNKYKLKNLASLGTNTVSYSKIPRGVNLPPMKMPALPSNEQELYERNKNRIKLDKLNI